MSSTFSRSVASTFLNGLAVVIPIFLTVAVLWWLAVSLENVLGATLKLVIPDRLYVPGLGIAVGVGMIFAAGLATPIWLTRRLIEVGQSVLERLPIAKTVFSGLSDLMHFVKSASSTEDMNKVVLVDVGEGTRVLGFVTDDSASLLEQIDGENQVPVFLQMSYQMGGYTVFVERSRLTHLDIPLEDAMRWVLTAGISRDKNTKADASC